MNTDFHLRVERVLEDAARAPAADVHWTPSANARKSEKRFSIPFKS